MNLKRAKCLNIYSLHSELYDIFIFLYIYYFYYVSRCIFKYKKTKYIKLAYINQNTLEN